MDYDDKLDAQSARYRLAELNHQLRGVRDRVFELLNELDAVEILRAHVPARRRWLFDRLELALRRIDWLDAAIADTETDCEIEGGDPRGAA